MTHEPSPLISIPLRWFLPATFLSGMSGRMYSLLLPLYLTRLGADVVQVGLVFTISSVVPIALPIFGGWISDTIGRLRAIALGSLGGLLGMIVMVVTLTSRALLSMPSPWLGGLLWDRSSPAMPFIVTVTACTGLGVLAWFKLRFSRRNSEGPAAV